MDAKEIENPATSETFHADGALRDRVTTNPEKSGRARIVTTGTTIEAEFSGIPFQIRAKKSYVKDGRLMRDFEVLCEGGKVPATKSLDKIAEVCSLSGDEFALVPIADSRSRRGMALFSNKILKLLEKNHVLEGVNESQIFACNALCDTMAKAAEELSFNTQSSGRRVTEDALLAFSYGKKPGAIGDELKEVFKTLRSIENKEEIEELRLLSIFLKLLIKKKEESKSLIRGEARRIFNQHMDSKGFVSWYLRAKGPDGKLMPTKYFGTALPNNIDLDLDRVNFHPQYVAERYGILPSSQNGADPASESEKSAFELAPELSV